MKVAIVEIALRKYKIKKWWVRISERNRLD
jgi:hypothetical protein